MIRLARLFGFGLISLSMFASCSKRETAAPVGGDAPSVPVGTTSALPKMESSPPKGESIYQLEMKLTDQDGKTVPLDVFRGHPTVVSMFYATCPAACPLLVRDIKVLEENVPPAVRDNVRVLLVSFDVQRDTPAQLMAMAQKLKVNLPRWKMTVAPSDDAARDLAAVLGFQYRKLEDGEFSHSARISLLDENGVVVAQAEGLGEAKTALLPELERRKMVH